MNINLGTSKTNSAFNEAKKEIFMNDDVTNALAKINNVLTSQISRIEQLKRAQDWTDYSTIPVLKIGACPGDGIGPSITNSMLTILKEVMQSEIAAGKVEILDIPGLTIENRIQHKAAIPQDVLTALKECHVILKGPTTTPQKGSHTVNIESANVAMRRELDLFACVRPIRVTDKNINWTFFRENTEGAYMLGSQGLFVNQDLAFDMKVISRYGAERILRLGFEYAKQNNKKSVSVITKSNVVKTTDGFFSEIAHEIAEEYKEFGIEMQEWYVDIMAAKLIDPNRQSEFEVLIMPNLYGDILTDLAGQIQGGVGTAGSANIGKQYAMFEAVHGSAPRMVDEKRDQYADPSSMIKAAVLMLEHVGYSQYAAKIDKALDICSQFERNVQLTGRSNGATGHEYASYVLDWIKNEELESVWESYSNQKVTSN